MNNFKKYKKYQYPKECGKDGNNCSQAMYCKDANALAFLNLKDGTVDCP